MAQDVANQRAANGRSRANEDDGQWVKAVGDRLEAAEKDPCPDHESVECLVHRVEACSAFCEEEPHNRSDTGEQLVLRVE